MIRTLAIIAAVSFVLCAACFAAAFAVAGGPFFIDDDLRFQPGNWSVDISDKATPGLQPNRQTAGRFDNFSA